MGDQRYNIFNMVHKALRNMLYDTALKIQRADFSNVVETEPVITQLEVLLLFFDEHTRHENTFILPVIKINDAKLVSDFEYEHSEDHLLMEDLRAYITQWKIETHNTSRALWGLKIFYAFNKFVAFNLSHANKEERVLNPVLWEHYSDHQIHEISQQIVQSIKPEILMTQSRWIMRSVSRPELIDWLSCIKRSTPAEVFKLYSQMAQEELPLPLWMEIKKLLIEEKLMV